MEVNISRTAAEAEASSRAPVGTAPTMRSVLFCDFNSVDTLCLRHLRDLLHGRDHGLRGHIVNDPNLSDCARQDKMWHAAKRLFVGEEPPHNALSVDLYRRQWTVIFYQRDDAL